MKGLIWCICTVILLGSMLIQPTGIFIGLFLLWCVLNAVAWISAYSIKRDFTVTTAAPIQVEKGMKVPLHFSVKHHAKWPLLQGLLEIRGRNELSQEVITKRVPLSLGAKDSMTLEFVFEAVNCGSWHIETTQLTVSSWLPFFRRTFPVKSVQKLTVWPVRFPVAIQVANQHTTDTMLALQQRVTTQQTNERLGLRPYRMGDSVKQIHWKLSAKQDELIVEEQLEEQQAAVQLYVEKTTDLAQYDVLLSLLLSLLEGCRHTATKATIQLDTTVYQASELEEIAKQLLSGSAAQKPTGDYVAIVGQENIDDSHATVLRLRESDDACQQPYDFTAETVKQKFAHVAL